jgi:hypothetical protein
MRKRGRKSAAELSIVAVAIDGYRPKPPGDLRDPEVQIWQAIVSSLPGGWFTRANEPLLTAYCRHVATSDRLARGGGSGLAGNRLSQAMGQTAQHERAGVQGCAFTGARNAFDSTIANAPANSWPSDR